MIEEPVLPDYDGSSLADVVPAVARAIGVPLPGDEPGPHALDLPPGAAYVLLLIDGLGSRLLDRHASVTPYLSSLAQDPQARTGTACVPSTTATSLTSLGTALPPGAHGMVGFTSRIPGTDRLLDALSWPQDVEPEQWQPHPTAWGRLRAAGAEVTVVGKPAFAGSGLTRAAHRDAVFVGATGIGQRIAAGVQGAGGRPSLTYVYDSELDATGHRHGVDSPAWLRRLAEVDDEAAQLREALPAHVRLLVVADHGMVDTSPTGRVDIDQRPELRDGLVLLGGEARFRHLYCREGAADDVALTWRAVAGERADVLTREEAVTRGWFGGVGEAVVARLGDVVVAARGDTGFFSSVDFPRETELVGLHGSLSADEMLIPLLVD